MEILYFVGMALALLFGVLALWIVCVCLALTLIRFNCWAKLTERRITNGRRYG